MTRKQKAQSILRAAIKDQAKHRDERYYVSSLWASFVIAHSRIYRFSHKEFSVWNRWINTISLSRFEECLLTGQVYAHRYGEPTAISDIGNVC